MSDPHCAWPLSDVRCPLPADASLKKRFPPEHIPDPGVLFAEMAYGLVLNERDPAWAKHADTEIERRQVQALQIRHVARDMKGHDLAAPLPRHFVIAGEPFEESEAPCWTLALAHDVLASLEVYDLHRQARHCGFFIIREREAALQFANDRVLMFRNHRVHNNAA